MDKLKFTALHEHVGTRVDKAVSEVFLQLTRSHAKKLFEDGSVLVNNSPVKPSQKLKAGDEVEVLMPPPVNMEIVPEDIELDIVYEDESVIVINKPAGMVVHPAAGNYSGTLVHALLMHCGDTLSSINGVIRPGIVHRLDKDTTGLMVAAKGDEAHLSLSDQLKNRTMKRRYTALVHGNIREDSGVIRTGIDRSRRDRKKMAVSQGGREAVTHFEVVERFGRYTLLHCTLETGRTHQIRVHMRHIGNPVVGDKTYGIKKEEFNLAGQLLHSGKIGFIHPKTNEYMEFWAKPPEAFLKVLGIIRK